MKYTIISINFNNQNGLEKTIESIYNQTCTDYEYFIVDGLSTDKSVEIANSYRDKFASKNIVYTVISEKDTGIYNAMNKGIDLAHGEYINFMNSGDQFANKNILEEIYNELENVDVLYGDSYAINKKGKICRYHFGTKPSNIIIDIPFCHQSSFTKTELAKQYKFNEKFKIQADYDMMLRLYLADKQFKQLYKFIAIYELNGVSSNWNNEDEIVKRENGLPNYKNTKSQQFICKFKRNVIKYVPEIFIKWKHQIIRKREKNK